MSTTTTKGESHRIYWQQYISSKNGTSNQNNSDHKSRRELITSSAAVRISHTGAKARDVTDLLRSTLKLGTNLSAAAPFTNSGDNQDSLVLVGTLYSLPRSHVQFQHELDGHSNGDASADAGKESQAAVASHTSPTHKESAVPVPSTYSSKSDPFHVVKSLAPNDDPLEVRRRMQDHLRELQEAAPVSRTIISPKLQWFFVPAPNETNSLIPNCVELDGYCTSLEDEESDEDENDDEADDEKELSQKSSTESFDNMVQSRFPWLCKEEDLTGQLSADVDQRGSLNRRGKRQDRLSQALSRQKAITLKSQCLSGYLWKRSRKDPQVWRKSYCVLTEDYLWSVSRIYESGEERFSKHSCIRLTRALLLEPSPDYIPLFRTPFAFEVVSGKGISHVFRAANKPMQTRWIEALSSRIVQSFENSLIDHAELIVADECLARNRRLAQHAVDPLWKVLQKEEHQKAERVGESIADDFATCHQRNEKIGVVLRWGMQVAAYRECCRHIQSMLPAKNPVVASSSPSSKTRSDSMTSEAVDPMVQCMIQTTWRRAAELLARATHVATQIQPKLSRSVETQCRHVDYIIHGRFRANGGGDGSNGDSPAGDHHDAPPVDLLDPLLTELQALAARVAFENAEEEK